MIFTEAQNNFLLANVEAFHLNVLLMLGIAVFGGTVGAKIFQRLRIPQVVGYILIGLLIGQAGFKIITASVIDQLEPLSYFALGIIGFLIGGELKFDIFKKYGRQFAAILISEGLAAFVLVGVSSGLLAYFFTHDLKTSVALGVVLGAISSATDPASTIQVLWEYKTRGALTTAVIAIVALDDALALSLYGIGSSIASALTGSGELGMAKALGIAFYEMGAALILGYVSGLLLYYILKKLHDPDASLTFVIGAVLTILGLSIALKLDVILSSMALGMTLINLSPRVGQKTLDIVKRFAPPIYVLFFVLVGARLNVLNFRGSALAIWLIVAYLVGRSVGKIFGSYFGAVLSGGREVIKKYLGMCLFAQGGVAIGLSILASHRFSGDISAMIVLVVATTTFIVQLGGPLFVKLGVTKAGEVGLNVTEDDLIKSYSVADVYDRKFPVIDAGCSLRQVVDIFSSTESTYYPVIDSEYRLIGTITMTGIRNFFKMQELSDWLVALDLMEQVIATTTCETPLSEAFELCGTVDTEHLPVTVSKDDMTLSGMLNSRTVHRALAAEVLTRQQKADNIRAVEL